MRELLNYKHSSKVTGLWISGKEEMSSIKSIFPLNAIIFIILVLSIQNFLVSCAKNESNDTGESMSENPSESRSIPVKTIICKPTIFEYEIHSNGRVDAYRVRNFISGIDGIIAYSNVINSLRVEEGELLLQFDLSELKMNLDRAKLNFFNTSVEFKSALMGFTRNTNVVSDTTKKKTEISTGFAEAKLDLQDAEIKLSKASIKAPFTGVLANVAVQSGMYVKAGDKLFTIYSDRDLCIEAQILETDYHMVQVNQLAEVTTAANVSRIYGARVAEVNPIVNENGLVTIKLKLLDVNGLLPGMNASVNIKVPQHEALAVPKEAIVIRSGKPVVFTLEDHVAKWNYVVTGKDNGSEIEIREGLNFSQKVIITNNLQLTHDSPVVEDMH